MTFLSSVHIEIVIKTTTVSAAGVVRAGVRIVTSGAVVATAQIHRRALPLHVRAIIAGVQTRTARCIACNSWADLLAVRLPRFVMRQNVFLRLTVQYIPVVIRSVDGFNPVASRVYYLNPYGSSLCAARDQHRHQACG
jgi:hypothetical protein